MKYKTIPKARTLARYFAKTGYPIWLVADKYGISEQHAECLLASYIMKQEKMK